MPRYRLTVEYDGGPYKGFQAQDGVASVQDALERAILGFSGERLRLQAAGRTDTGVHATGQVIHFDLAKDWRAEVVRDAMNAHLVPDPISILSAERVGDDFHARFSATGRRYLYRILDRRSPAALERARVWWVKAPLDADPMHAAARTLIGTHDFTTFRDTHCQSKSPVKTLDRIDVARVGEEVHVTLAARSFLHRQVRSIVGSLAEVGVGRWSAERLAAALAAADRTACGQVAPAHGLYLTGVTYEGPPRDASVVTAP
jgi:tRNA pseudouridine38-40 synthase